VILSALGLCWGLHWSSQERPRIERHGRFVDSFERKLQALTLAREVPKPPVGFFDQQLVDIPGVGVVEFPASMTGPEIREAILRRAAEEEWGVGKPAWYWYASLIAVPLLVSLAPLALYGVVRWVAEGFIHAGK